MTTTDHYAAAERLLDLGEQVVSEIRAVPDGADRDRRRDALGKQAMGIWAQAQVHATLATVQRDQPWIPPWVPNLGDEGLTSRDPDEQAAIPGDEADRFLDAMQGVRTIPWPPSDELVERVASMLEATDGGDYDAIARAVLDAIDGDRR